MNLNQTQIEKYAKDFIEAKAYLVNLKEKRRLLNIEFEEQEARYSALEYEILAKFENSTPIAVVIGKKIFTIISQQDRRRTTANAIQIWDAALG